MSESSRVNVYAIRATGGPSTPTPTPTPTPTGRAKGEQRGLGSDVVQTHTPIRRAGEKDAVCWEWCGLGVVCVG